jgi:hypothetical protein
MNPGCGPDPGMTLAVQVDTVFATQRLAFLIVEWTSLSVL